MLDEYTLTEDNKTTHEMLLGTDELSETDLYVAEGEKFRMVVGNAIPESYDGDDNTLLVIIEAPSGTIQIHESLDGSFISTTDWDGVKEDINASISSITALDPDADISIIDTSSEFGMDINYTYSDSDENGNISVSVIGDVRFNKDTGVMKRFDVMSSSLFEHLSSTNMFFERTKMSYIADEVSDGLLSLPGFELYLGLFGIFITIVITKKKYK